MICLFPAAVTIKRNAPPGGIVTGQKGFAMRKHKRCSRKEYYATAPKERIRLILKWERILNLNVENYWDYKLGNIFLWWDRYENEMG